MALAEVFKQWLPGVIQAVKPYYSPDDITKGARWSSEIAKILEESRVGIICVTRTNIDAPWIMFEAGALAKNLERGKVAPILFGVEPTDLTGPLVQFQAAKFEMPDVKRVVRMINSELGENKLPTDVLDNVFEMWWPRLQERVQAAIDSTQPVGGARELRSNRELLEEILVLSRSLAKHGRAPEMHPKAIKDLVGAYELLIQDACDSANCQAVAQGIRQLQPPIRYIVSRFRRGHGANPDTGLLLALDVATKKFEDAARTGLDSGEDDDLPF
jgi:hypothetical protein